MSLESPMGAEVQRLERKLVDSYRRERFDGYRNIASSAFLTMALQNALSPWVGAFWIRLLVSVAVVLLWEMFWLWAKEG